jgi:RNA polymerase sigma factor (sigma-70 family)
MGLSTGVGVLKVKIWYGLDPGSGRWGCPMRQRWGLGPHQEMSPALEDKLAFTVTATRPCGVIMNKNSCPVWPVGADILVEMNARGLRLLEQYTRQGAEEAFAVLVREHLDLVYSAALRAVHSPQLAEEVAQAVFTDLARQAHKMKPNTLLSAWLYRVTRRTAIDVVRRESRRQRREQVAVELAEQDSTTSSEWSQAEPLLDEAMDALPEADRNAVLLRFFEGKDLKDVGGGLGVSEEAARKRVARAVERLRQFFLKRGVEIGSAGVAALLSAKAVEAAPAGLAAAIAAALSTSSAVLGGAATLQLTKAIAMTTIQKVALAAVVAAALGTAVYKQHRLSQMRQQIQALEQQQEPLATQINALIQERDRLAASLQAAQEQHVKDVADLPKLRAENTRLRNQARDEAQAKPGPGGPVSETLAAKVALLRQKLEQMPGQKIPELKFADEVDWLKAAQRVQTDSDDDVRKGLSLPRTLAEIKAVPYLQSTLQGYIAANNGNPLTSVDQLKPFLQAPLDEAILDRYQPIPGPGGPYQVSLREKADASIDTTYDTWLTISPRGYGYHAGDGVIVPDDVPAGKAGMIFKSTSH